MRKSLLPLLFIIIPLIISCWDSSPTSQNKKNYKVGGVVTDKNGNGISGVIININGNSISISDTTDSVGIFAFDGFKSGSYIVKAQKDSCFFKPANMNVKVGKSDIDTLKFIYADNYIHGRVLDIMTDKGIPGIMVVLSKEVYSLFPDGSVKNDIRGESGFSKIEKSELSSSPVDSIITDIKGEFGFFDVEMYNYTLRFGQYDKYSLRVNNYQIKSQAFSSSEIIIPTYYISSEKLKITTAKFSKDTKTLNLEWTPSKSAYVDGYWLYKRNAPFKYIGPGVMTRIDSSSYSDNKMEIIISPEYLKNYFDETDSTGVVYFAVSAIYHKGSDFIFFQSPISDDVNLRLYW
jgi:hypothetical protein